MFASNGKAQRSVVRTIDFQIIPSVVVDDGRSLRRASLGDGRPFVVTAEKALEWLTTIYPQMIAAAEAQLNGGA
jgi:hypothetical protein